MRCRCRLQVNARRSMTPAKARRILFVSCSLNHAKNILRQSTGFPANGIVCRLTGSPAKGIICRLTGVIGRIVHIGPIITTKTYAGFSKRIEISLIDDSHYHQSVTLTVWEDTLHKHNNFLTGKFQQDTNLVAVALRIKLFKGKHILETTCFTDLFFNSTSFPQSNELSQWFENEFTKQLKGSSNSATQSKNIVTTESTEKITITELLAKTPRNPPTQAIHYSVDAQLISIYTNESVWYDCYSIYRRKIKPPATKSSLCTNTDCQTMGGKITSRYKVRAIIEDEEDRTNVVLFDRHAQTILRQPIESTKEMFQQHNGVQVFQRHVEKCLNISYNFELQITKDNFKFLDNSGYTVSRIERITRTYKPVEYNINTSSKGSEDETDSDFEKE